MPQPRRPVCAAGGVTTSPGVGVVGGGDGLPRSLHPRLAVRAFELETGAPRFEVELDRTWRPDQLQLVPFERGLLARNGPATLWALRDA